MEPSAGPKRLRVASSRPRVVLAEDDQSMRALMADRLRRDGFEVLEARCGTDLLYYLILYARGGADEATLDLLITDCHMPTLCGLDALAWLRRFDRDTPAILITAFADEEMREIAGQLGAVLFDKPFEIDVLGNAALALVREVLVECPES